MNLKQVLFIALIPGLVGLTACSPATGQLREQERDQVPIPIQIPINCTPEFREATQGRRVQVEGFLHAPKSGSCNNEGCGFQIKSWPTANFHDYQKLIVVLIRPGEGPNQVRVPTGWFQMSQIVYHDDTGAAFTYRNKVRVTGEMRAQFLLSDWFCKINNPTFTLQ